MMGLVSDKQFLQLSSFLRDRGLFPAGSELSQTILLQLYRVLAAGQPVEVSALAHNLGLETAQVGSVLQQIPPSNIVWNQDGNISAYRGLDIDKSRHRIVIQGKNLYTWCVFDCLFLPQLLNCEAEIFSTCPQTGDKIRLRLDSKGKPTPATVNLFVSFIVPEVSDYHDDLRQTFCCHVNFFVTKAAGAAWIKHHAGTVLITLAQAVELAAIRNKTGFGKVLV
jgi:alkylmercury lyase